MPKGFPTDVVAAARRKLAMLHAAARLDDLRIPPSNRLEALRGDRAGQHSIRVNDRWRVCFVWQDGHAHEVEIVDCHRGGHGMPTRHRLISRKELDAGCVRFGDVATAARLPSVTPGEILREEFLVPMGLSATRLAREIGVPANRITAILAGTRAITADTALRVAARFGTSAEFWMNLQTAHDHGVARQALAAA
jgi:proteic killer suppression protein